MKKLSCGFLAIALIATSGWALPPSVGPDLSSNVTIPAALAAPQPKRLVIGASVIIPPSAPMPDATMSSLPDVSYRELEDSVTMRQLLAPRVIYSWNVGETAQVQALGAPVSAMPAETPASQHQARFPLFIFAW